MPHALPGHPRDQAFSTWTFGDVQHLSPSVGIVEAREAARAHRRGPGPACGVRERCLTRAHPVAEASLSHARQWWLPRILCSTTRVHMSSPVTSGGRGPWGGGLTCPSHGQGFSSNQKTREAVFMGTGQAMLRGHTLPRVYC